MGRRAGVLVAGLVLVAACSGGGSKTAAPTTTSSSAPSTTTSTTTTTLPSTSEDQVKQAYLAYWSVIDRLASAPDPDDPELARVATEPILSFARDRLATDQATGNRTVTPPGGHYSHLITAAVVNGSSATITECSVDDQQVLDANGAVVDSEVVTKTLAGSLAFDGRQWRVSDVKVVDKRAGIQACGG